MNQDMGRLVFGSLEHFDEPRRRIWAESENHVARPVGDFRLADTDDHETVLALDDKAVS